MWELRLNIVDCCYFKIQTLHEILKTQNQHQAEFLCIFGRRTFLLVGWMCKKQTSVSHSSSESEIVSLGAGLRMDGLLALDLFLVIEELDMTHIIPTPTQACTLQIIKTITPKIKQVLDQIVNPSNIDQVPLYFCEDNETGMKTIIEGRSPTMRHESRAHRVAPDWLFDRVNLDPKVQINYVESQTPLADIVTKSSFTRDEWHILLHPFFHSLNDTTFSCSHFQQSFFSFRKKAIRNVEKISRTLFTWFANGESEIMLTRFATVRVCETRLVK